MDNNKTPENNKKHKDNMAYIAEILADKPVTADRIKQALEYSANNLVGAKIVFPDLPVPVNVEFCKEHYENGLVSGYIPWEQECLDKLDYEDAKKIYYES